MNRLLFLVALCGCEDALDQRLSIIHAPRVIAIVSEPPEVKPGADAMLSAVVVSPDGPLSVAPAWALCAAPKPPTEDNSVADGCIADQVSALGIGPDITATIPSDACRTFGPDVAMTGFRPRDPDPTGGYYQPVRAAIPDLDLAFGTTRITCNLANAPGDLAQTYKTSYVANANPSIPLVTAPATAAPNSDVSLTAAWPDTDAEAFLYYDPTSQTLITRRESMRLSWFATAGELAVDASAVGETDRSASVTTTWHAPATPGTVYLWFVLRDSRGGIATASTTIDVR